MEGAGPVHDTGYLAGREPVLEPERQEQLVAGLELVEHPRQGLLAILVSELPLGIGTGRAGEFGGVLGIPDLIDQAPAASRSMSGV